MQIDKPRNAVDQISDLRARAPTRALVGSQSRFFEGEHRMIPGAYVPVRSMLVGNVDERILISPIGTSEESDAIGRDLTTLVSPSLLHHVHLLEAIERMEPRELWGPAGLAAKVPELGHARVFGQDAWPHGDQLDFVVVEGAASNEVALFHRATSTLFVADLVMNIQAPHGLLTPLIFRAMGIHKRFAMPAMWRRWVTDRAKFVRSMDRILAWDFERIAMAHGAMVVADARATFEHALHERRLYD